MARVPGVRRRVRPEDRDVIAPRLPLRRDTFLALRGTVLRRSLPALSLTFLGATVATALAFVLLGRLGLIAGVPLWLLLGVLAGAQVLRGIVRIAVPVPRTAFQLHV